MEKKLNWISLVGWGILTATVSILLIASTIASMKAHVIGGIVLLIVLLGVVLAVIKEFKNVLHLEPDKPGTNHLLSEALAVFGGAILAYLLANTIGLGAVVAAAVIGILAFILVPKFAVPAYCGAFVGMTSKALLLNANEIAVAGILAAVVYFFTRQVFGGFGGKLGTIALTSTALTCASFGRPFAEGSIAGWQTNLLIVLVSVLAALFTFYLNTTKGHGPVLASAFVGLVAGLVLPTLLPDTGKTLAVVAICASFAGMSSKVRCTSYWQILFTGILTGLVFVFSTPLFGGAGGKLGTIAFASILATCGLRTVLGKILPKKEVAEAA